MPTGLATTRSTSETTFDLDRFVQSLETDPSGSTTYYFLLGLEPSDHLRIQTLVHEGVPYSTLERFRQAASLSLEQTAQLIHTPVRSLTRRRRDSRLRPDETDRLFRAAWVVARALALYDGDLRRARKWLESPQYALGGLVPFTLASTFDGARQVSDVIGRIEHGLGV
jgi:putative toxin-antitoxin system antitoxin component (TIGR02293 family)